jgi:uncharacterized protein YjiS (DUF1127 family)
MLRRNIASVDPAARDYFPPIESRRRRARRGAWRRTQETKIMLPYSETELLRVARVRTDLDAERRRLILVEANRMAAQARAEAIGTALAAIGRVVGRVVGALAAWRRYRVAMAELSALDNRMLGDIGISRAEIPRVAAGLWMPDSRGTSAVVTPTGTPGNANARQAAA